MEQNILNYLSIKLSGCTRNPEKESCIAPEIHPADQMMSFYTAKNIRVINSCKKQNKNPNLALILVYQHRHNYLNMFFLGN